MRVSAEIRIRVCYTFTELPMVENPGFVVGILTLAGAVPEV